MLLPLPLGPMGEEMELNVPCVITDWYKHFWWGLMVLFVGATVMNTIGGDVFGVLFMGIMSYIIWYMTANTCKNMSQYCLMLFGLMCVIQASFELVTVLMLVSGRTVRHTSVSTQLSPDGSQKTQTVTTLEETHPYFDASQGFRYNVQSAAHIVSPSVMFFGAILAYFCYNAYPQSLLSGMNRPDEAGPINQGRSGGYPPYGGAGGGGFGGGGAGMGGSGGGGTRISGGQILGGGRSTGPRAFEGQGQRLGSS